MATVLIPYRGDLVTARHGYKAAKKQSLRKFKRKLLKEWDLYGRVLLWGDQVGYVNPGIRKVLGMKDDFLESTAGITAFGIELRPAADVNKVLELSDDQKDFLRNKCLGIFSKYGHRINTSYVNGNYEFSTFKEEITEDPETKKQTIRYIETSYEGEPDEEIASMLYDRMVMYMINNDSTDTIDSWNNIHEEKDFFNKDARSTLKSYSTTFKSSDIRRMVNDRLFSTRLYKTTTKEGFAFGVDMNLFNELLDDGFSNTINELYWGWNGTLWVLDIPAIRALPADEFVIFIQTHLATWTEKPKKKWYQEGVFGVIFAVVIVVIAVLTQQYYLIGVALGTVLVVAGMVISVTGAILGNEVMMMAGQVVSIIGGGINVFQSIMAEQVAMQAVQNQLATQGLNSVAIQQGMSQVANEMLLNQMLGAGKFIVSTAMTVNSMLNKPELQEDLKESVTPREKINEVYVADDMSWDYVQQFMPSFIIANALRIM